MPITPFHIIAAAPIKAIIPRHFSWSIFTLTNIFIDLEPITYFIFTGIPSHKFFHSIFGATLIGLICALYFRKLCGNYIMKWNKSLHQIDRKWLEVRNYKIHLFEGVTGGLIGAWSHITLDSMMHQDIKPFWPFSSSNPIQVFMSPNSILYLCLGLLSLGIILFVIKKIGLLY
jgi:membrane-bound metal-dependent hydrolase YbcI (DUF457 family)